MICRDGKTSLISFCGAIITTIFISFGTLSFLSLELNTFRNAFLCFAGPIAIYALICVICYFVNDENDFGIITRATVLGICFGLSLISLCYAPNAWKRLATYFLFLATFHYSEYLTISATNPQILSTDTFMLNHSIPYIIAATSSWLEFLIEVFLWPSIKQNSTILVIGIAVCIGGEVIRKLAIITASTSFNHVVQYHRNEDHVLVTHGIYSSMRHPSYAGWFWWSVGTQIILANPLCLILYAIVSWKFFQQRILIEEVTLVKFFGEKYLEYQQTTPTGVPFVKGYVEGGYDESSFK